jgi:hypothetical protein
MKTTICALMLALALTPVAARAEPPSEDRAAEVAARKKAGDEAMEALRYADALAAYTEVHAVTREPALLYNMGRALQALNRFPEALGKLEAFEAAASAELKARVPRLPKLIAELRARVATVRLSTNVEGAKFLVRSTVVGRAPLPAPLRFTAGPAEIEVEAEGYYPARKSLDLKGGEEIAVELTLASKSTTGVLSVQASAPHAEVLVDGARVGIAPIEVNVPKGEHKISVRAPDRRPYETAAVVPAGGTRTVVADLQASSVARRWWFWAGVGAVVAAGAGVAIAAASTRHADSGTIAPGQLHTGTAAFSAPLLRF